MRRRETPVVSNNSAHRWTPDVPMVVPEINPEHFEVIKDPEEDVWEQQEVSLPLNRTVPFRVMPLF